MEGGTSTVVNGLPTTEEPLSHILSNVLKLQDKKCISAYLFSIGLDDQDPSQWDDADLSHLVVTDADYPSDSKEEGEETKRRRRRRISEEKEEEVQPRCRVLWFLILSTINGGR
jgi:hypothetical protein